MPNNKITSFFKPSTKSESKIIIQKNDSEEKNLVKISSISIGEDGKFKLNSSLKSLGVYKYVGESLENISKSDYVVVNEVHSRNDIRYIYCLINKKQLLSIKFFLDSKNNEKYLNIQDYLISSNLSEKFLCIENPDYIDSIPFCQDSFKFYLHPSLYQKETFRKHFYIKLLGLLGAKLEENIRMSDICIINRQDMTEHFPGHVRLINESFIFDCFYHWKVSDLDRINYVPEKLNIKK